MGEVTRLTDPADPRRCQGINKKGQCGLLALDGTHLCAMHGGQITINATERRNLGNYKLSLYQNRLEDKKGSSEVKGLRDEIGILRIMIEDRLNQCKNDVDLMVNSGSIADMVMKVEKLVSSCHKLEGSMGQLLDKQAILQFAGIVIDLITKEFGDQPEKLSRLADQIMSSVGGIGSDAVIEKQTCGTIDLSGLDDDEG